MPHQFIALYNRKGERLLTLREAEKKGYGWVITLKQRLHRGQIKGYKAGTFWLVLQQSLPRPAKRRRPKKTYKIKQKDFKPASKRAD